MLFEGENTECFHPFVYSTNNSRPVHQRQMVLLFIQSEFVARRDCNECAYY